MIGRDIGLTYGNDADIRAAVVMSRSYSGYTSYWFVMSASETGTKLVIAIGRPESATVEFHISNGRLPSATPQASSRIVGRRSMGPLLSNFRNWVCQSRSSVRPLSAVE